MIISDVIAMLEKAISQHGDIEVYVDLDYGQRVVEADSDPLCECPSYEPAAGPLPERIVI
jgi:hypothetical protein